ncbi:NADH-quinone oxidoreductase subunit N [compost metagenome]
MMLSLAGIPLTSGFIGKFYILIAGVQAQLWGLIAVLILGSAIGIYYYLRVMVTLYLVEPGMRRREPPINWPQRAGGVMLLAIAVLSFLLGVYPQPLLVLAQAAGF